MEDNMIVWKKKHMEAKGTFTSWRFFSFTPTNKYKCSPWKCHWGFGLAATLRTNEQNNITQVDREGEHMLISEQKKPKLQAKVGFHFYCSSMGGTIADLQSIPASTRMWTLCLKHRFTSFNSLVVVRYLLGLYFSSHSITLSNKQDVPPQILHVPELLCCVWRPSPKCLLSEIYGI